MANDSISDLTMAVKWSTTILTIIKMDKSKHTVLYIALRIIEKIDLMLDTHSTKYT